jgi:bacterioferritin-associated ferredoxin
LTNSEGQGNLTKLSGPPEHPGAHVIVCHCEAVNDKAVRAAVLSGASDVSTVGERCRAGTNCGGCHRMLERLLREHVAPTTAAVAVA